MPYFTWRVSRRSRFSQSPYNCKLTMQKPWGHLSAPHLISGKILWFTSFHPWPCRKECRFGFPRGQGFEIEAEVARKCDPVDGRNPATQLMFGEYAIFPQDFMCTKTDGAGFLPSTVWPPTRVNVLHIIHHWPYYIHFQIPRSSECEAKLILRFGFPLPYQSVLAHQVVCLCPSMTMVNHHLLGFP